MLIRITRNSEGIEHYLESGKKRGRDKSRDTIDRRVHLGGDLMAFSQAVSYTQKYKKWKNNYIHITASFSIENNHLNDKTLSSITNDLLDYYFCDYKKESLIYACEAHRPLIQSEVNKSTGEATQRLLHLHLAVSMLDVNTGIQVRMLPYKHESDKAFQSLIAKKYGLVDPATQQRKIKYTKKDIIQHWNSNTKIIHKQTKVSDLRKLFSTMLVDIKSLDEVKKTLNKLDIVAHVTLKKQKSGNQYLQVKTTLETRHINLRGKGFEHLEKLYYSKEELKERIEQGKFKDDKTQSNMEIVTHHKNWWLEQQGKRKPKKINHKKIEDTYEKKYKNRIKESRVYYVLYKNNIKEELIRGFSLWEKNNIKYLFNHDLGIKIYDRPNKITAFIPDDAEKRKKTVRLLLEMAVAKGWNLKTMNISGGIEFRKEVQAQIKAIIVSEKKKLDVSQPDPEKNRDPTLNVVKQHLFESKEKDAKKYSKEDILSIKNELNAQSVMEYAIKEFELIKTYFNIIDKKINDNRTKEQPKNVIDFLTKNCNVPFRDALPILNQLLQEQRKQLDIAISNENDESYDDFMRMR